MSLPRILLALHRPGADRALAEALESRGFPVTVSRNMATTWGTVRALDPDVILVAPRDADPEAAELRSLLGLASAPDGPALVVLTEHPEAFAGLAETLDDALSLDTEPDALARRLRFVAGRRGAMRHMAAEQRALRERASRDSKTGLFNHQHFQERKAEEISRARRQGTPLGVVVIDLDDFKAINDENDHVFGDWVLRRFADCLRSHLRNFDIAARFGGDEFIVLLPNTQLPEMEVVAERLRTAVADLDLAHDGHDAALTISIGIADWHPDAGHDFDASVRRADRAVLDAKRSGRNQVRSHGKQESPSSPSSPSSPPPPARGRGARRRPRRDRDGRFEKPGPPAGDGQA